MKTKLEILEEKVKMLKEKQVQCSHEWSEIEYDPERKEITIEELVYLGPADSYYKEIGTGRYVNIDRWSRVCKKCEKKEYAYEIEEIPIETIKRPKF